MGLRRRGRLTASLLLAAAVAVSGCGTSGSRALSLPTVPASPADQPTPPATAPVTPATAAASTVAPGSAEPPRPSAVRTPHPAGPTGFFGPCAQTTVALRSDRATYAPGQTVHLVATLINAGSADCTIQAGAERGFTVVAGTTTVWRSGCASTPGGHTATEPCPQFIALMPIKAGATLTRDQDWSQQADGSDRQVAAGHYTASETWAGKTASTTFTIS